MPCLLRGFPFSLLQGVSPLPRAYHLHLHLHVLFPQVTRGSYLSVSKALVDIARFYPDMCEAFLNGLQLQQLGEVAVPARMAKDVSCQGCKRLQCGAPGGMFRTRWRCLCAWLHADSLRVADTHSPLAVP